MGMKCGTLTKLFSWPTRTGVSEAAAFDPCLSSASFPPDWCKRRQTTAKGKGKGKGVINSQLVCSRRCVGSSAARYPNDPPKIKGRGQEQQSWECSSKRLTARLEGSGGGCPQRPSESCMMCSWVAQGVPRGDSRRHRNLTPSVPQSAIMEWRSKKLGGVVAAVTWPVAGSSEEAGGHLPFPPHTHHLERFSFFFLSFFLAHVYGTGSCGVPVSTGSLQNGFLPLLLLPGITYSSQRA